MSNRYKGGVISATPPTTTGGESGTASGAWTLEQQMQLTAAGLWPAQPTGPYVEELFSTWLYTGTGSALTITNGLDLSGKGGLVWLKSRSASESGHFLDDTVRGANKTLVTNSDSAQASGISTVTAFNSNGFNVGTFGGVNTNGVTYVSWAFREQPKFFDIATWTGNGGIQTISHNLGSTPGCIIIKAVTSSGGSTAWAVWHRSIPGGYGLLLNATTSSSAIGEIFATSVNSSSFVVNIADTSRTNYNGVTYIAYIYAHDAGGFGLTNTDNVISCGSTDGSKVTLGYEPQWILYRSYDFSDDWQIVDNMRGLPVGAVARKLEPNTPDAEDNTSNSITIAANGFTLGAITGTAIYIAIRRGPMRTPTVGTSVFYPTTYTGTGSARTFSGFGFPPDFEMSISTGGSAAGDNNGPEIFDKLRGTRVRLLTPSTDAQFTTSESVTMIQDGISVSSTTNSYINASGFAKVLYGFKRAPSFFDEVCYAGQNSAPLVNSHNLGVTPELAIIKNRTTATDWLVQTQITGLGNYLNLNTLYGLGSAPYFITAWTSTTFTLSNGITATNTLGSNYVAWLFATCPGVSKVGSYTGTGATQTINCGFTGGARFVLIKRTDDSGGWYVWDTARGMVSGTDPSFFLNSTAAEVNANSIYTIATGFQIVSTASGINASGGTYIFLAIA